MPTPNGYTLCPFFDHESGAIITCEDTARRFRNEETKLEHKATFCDNDWISCRFAQAMVKAYEAEENGEKDAVNELRLESRKQEILSLFRKLTRAERKIRARDEEIASLREKNHALEDTNRNLFALKRKVDDELAELKEKIFAEIQGISQFYESRLSFMMDTYSGGILHENDVVEWAKDKEYRIIKMDGDEIVWKVETRKEENKGRKEKDSERLYTGEQINNRE